MKKLLSAVSLPLLALSLQSCVNSLSSGTGHSPGYLAGLGLSQPLPARSTNPFDHEGFWDGDGVAGAPSIRISRAHQKAYFYKDNHLVGVSPVSTGTPERQTLPGSFKVQQKSIDHSSSLYGIIRDVATGQVVNDDADSRVDKPGPGQVYEGAPMPNFLRFDGGVGMHTGFLPGYPASHGCVRMPNHMAEKFFKHATVGTPVLVE